MMKWCLLSFIFDVALYAQDASPIQFTGAFEATPVHANSSGNFDALRVKVGIVPVGESCSGYVRLSDSRGSEIDFENFNQRVTTQRKPADIVIHFQGAKIAAHGVDGPWLISSVSGSCF